MHILKATCSEQHSRVEVCRKLKIGSGLVF